MAVFDPDAVVSTLRVTGWSPPYSDDDDENNGDGAGERDDLDG